MQVQITGNSATTEQVRKLAVALHVVGLTDTLMVGVEGPDHWHFSTPKMTANQWARVSFELLRQNPANDARFRSIYSDSVKGE